MIKSTSHQTTLAPKHFKPTYFCNHCISNVNKIPIWSCHLITRGGGWGSGRWGGHLMDPLKGSVKSFAKKYALKKWLPKKLKDLPSWSFNYYVSMYIDIRQPQLYFHEKVIVFQLDLFSSKITKFISNWIQRNRRRLLVRQLGHHVWRGSHVLRPRQFHHQPDGDSSQWKTSQKGFVFILQF